MCSRAPVPPSGGGRDFSASSCRSGSALQFSDSRLSVGAAPYANASEQPVAAFILLHGLIGHDSGPPADQERRAGGDGGYDHQGREGLPQGHAHLGHPFKRGNGQISTGRLALRPGSPHRRSPGLGRRLGLFRMRQAPEGQRER